MRYYSQYLYDFKEFIVLFICIFISLILIFSNDDTNINAIKIAAINAKGFLVENYLITPEFSNKAKMKKQIQFLRTQNTSLALENSRMRNAIVENKRLRSLIFFIRESKFDFKVGKVIGIDRTGFMNQLLLDIGMKQGIEREMPVVLPEGLVGKIYETADDYAVCQLLLDKNFRVSVKVVRNSVKGILTWENGDTMLLTQVPNRARIEVGDSVMTSGFSRIFPEGIFVGKVLEANDSKRSIFMKITVKPELNFSRLEEVLILTNQDGKNQFPE